MLLLWFTLCKWITNPIDSMTIDNKLKVNEKKKTKIWAYFFLHFHELQWQIQTNFVMSDIRTMSVRIYIKKSVCCPLKAKSGAKFKFIHKKKTKQFIASQIGFLFDPKRVKITFPLNYQIFFIFYFSQKFYTNQSIEVWIERFVLLIAVSKYQWYDHCFEAAESHSMLSHVFHL